LKTPAGIVIQRLRDNAHAPLRLGKEERIEIRAVNRYGIITVRVPDVVVASLA